MYRAARGFRDNSMYLAMGLGHTCSTWELGKIIRSPHQVGPFQEIKKGHEVVAFKAFGRHGLAPLLISVLPRS